VIRLKDTDRLLVLSTLLLLATGIVMVYSTSYVMAMKRFGDEYFFFKKHLRYALGGLVVFVAASRVPYPIYRTLTYPILVISAVFLSLVFIPGLGSEAGGAQRWLKLGPLAFQPSEPAKLAVVFFLAYSLAAKSDRIRSFSFGFLPNIVTPGLIVGLIALEPDLGTAVTLSAVVVVMSFIGGVRPGYLAGLGLAALPFLYVFMQNFRYTLDRWSVYLDPWKDPQGKGFQMVQSFLAFGSGGISGVGLGEGRQKLFYLPEAHTDFILSVIGEELGLIGVASVIFFYILFFYSGARIALRARDLHGTYLALGLTILVALQAIINMAVVVGLVPPKGLPLPLVSYGGSSLLVNMAAAGIILNVCIKGNEA
jgi:cell division protein FtsW